MKNGRKTMRKSIKFGAAVAALAFTATSAMAITDSEFLYNKDKTRFFTVHPMAMQVDGNASATNYFVSWSGASLTGDGCFMTSVNLPNGARVVSIRTWSVGQLFVNFTLETLGSGATTSLFSGTVGDTSGNRVTTLNTIPTTAPAIASTTALGLGVCVDPFNSGDPYTESFNGARIEYTVIRAGE